jgi:hypothetical protein
MKYAPRAWKAALPDLRCLSDGQAQSIGEQLLARLSPAARLALRVRLEMAEESAARAMRLNLMNLAVERGPVEVVAHGNFQQPNRHGIRDSGSPFEPATASQLRFG